MLHDKCAHHHETPKVHVSSIPLFIKVEEPEIGKLAPRPAYRPSAVQVL